MCLNVRYARFGKKSSRRGFALVSVLWGITFLSLIAGSLLQLRKNSSYLVRDAHNGAELEMAVKAGMSRAILGLSDARDDKRWRVDGAPIIFSFNDISVTVSIQDENGKIDLNASDRETLLRLFQSVGIASDDTTTMVDRVLDWRESNDQMHLNGNNNQDYRASGAKYRPRHQAFQSVDELNLVMGMTPDLSTRLRPALTVYSQRQQIDQETAPREVLLTLPGMNTNLVDKMLNDRLKATVVSGQSIFVRPGIIDPRLPLEGRSFTITAACQVGQKKVVHEEVIRITNSMARPFLVLMWK